MLDIILVILAWRRGWGARALLPMGVVMASVLVLEFIGISVFENDTLLWGVSIIEYGALITMIVKPRTRVSVAKNAPAQPGLEYEV